MDPDLIRLILLVFGVAFVVGIYLWDRYKRAPGARYRNRRRPRMERSVATEVGSGEAPVRATAGEKSEPPPAAGPDDVTPEAPLAPEDFEPLDQSAKAEAPVANPLDPEPTSLGDWSGAASKDTDPQFSMDLAFEAHSGGDYLHSDPALREDVEPMVLVIGVVARDRDISGPAIEQAMAAAGFTAGEMSIYHWRDPATTQVLFSLANMLEPGTFPFAAMAQFSTPGLTLFTQLPGPRDSVQIYDQMLASGDQLAQLLKAELQDDRHNKLTRQMRDHLRESVIDYHRRMQLARSRH